LSFFAGLLDYICLCHPVHLLSLFLPFPESGKASKNRLDAHPGLIRHGLHAVPQDKSNHCSLTDT